jgi:hypothetical protein
MIVVGLVGRSNKNKEVKNLWQRKRRQQKLSRKKQKSLVASKWLNY